MLPTENPRIPEGINHQNEHPLKEFAILLVGISVAITVLIFLLNFSFRLLAPHIPVRWEVSLSDHFLDAEGSPTKSEPKALDREQQTLVRQEQTVQRLGRDLVTVSLQLEREAFGQEKGRSNGFTADQFRFHLIDTAMANAFATLGANVFVTEGLVSSTESENALAMVIAHEIAHVYYRHPIISLGQGGITQVAFSLVFGGSVGGLSNTAITSSGLFALLHFSRAMEREADDRALAILQRYYGHVCGADEFFTSMAAQGEAAWLEFAQTHPNSNNRAISIRDRIEQQGGCAGKQLKDLPIWRSAADISA